MASVNVNGFSEDDPPIWFVTLTRRTSAADLRSWVEENPSVRRLDVELEEGTGVSAGEVRSLAESHGVEVEAVREAGPEEDRGVTVRA